MHTSLYKICFILLVIKRRMDGALFSVESSMPKHVLRLSDSSVVHLTCIRCAVNYFILTTAAFWMNEGGLRTDVDVPQPSRSNASSVLVSVFAVLLCICVSMRSLKRKLICHFQCRHIKHKFTARWKCGNLGSCILLMCSFSCISLVFNLFRGVDSWKGLIIDSGILFVT